MEMSEDMVMQKKFVRNIRICRRGMCMKRKFKIFVCLIIILAACFGYAHIDKMHSVFDTEVDPSLYVSTSIDSKEEYRQEFVCEEKILDGIAVKFNITGEEIDKVKLIYCIEDEHENVIREGTLSGDKFRNQKYNKLGFETIENTKGKKFIVKIHLENNDAENGVSFLFEGEKLVLKYYAFRFDVETFMIACFFCAYVVGFMKILFKMFKE